MTTTFDAHPHTQQTIRLIVDLLHDAYQQTWDTADLRSPRVDLGLGIYLARAQACRWLTPTQHTLPRQSRCGQGSVPELLWEAERLTRDLPLSSSTLADAAEFTIALCHLIRDARRVPW